MKILYISCKNKLLTTNFCYQLRETGSKGNPIHLFLVGK